MGKILVEKLSYTEVNKNISQTEYEKIQEEYLLSRSPEKYMISMPVRVLMFEGLEREPNIRYIFMKKTTQTFSSFRIRPADMWSIRQSFP